MGKSIPHQQDNTPKIAQDTRIQQEVQCLIKAIRRERDDKGVVKRKANKEEIQQLITTLGSDSFQEREAASKELEAIGYPAKPDLKKALHDPDPEKVRRAEQILDIFNAADYQRSQNLLGYLHRLHNVGLSLDAPPIDAVPSLAKYAVPTLIEVLADENADVRESAARILWYMGPAAKAALPAMIHALKDDSPKVRSISAAALGSVGAEARMVVPGLIEALKDKVPDVRESAVITQGKIGPEARAAVPDLITAFKDNGSEARMSIVITLGKIGPKARMGVPLLVEVLNDWNPEVRTVAAESLGEIGPEARAAVPGLIKALKDYEPPVREAAAIALGRMGSVARAAIPGLTALMDAKPDKNENDWWSPRVKRQAAAAIEAIKNGRGRTNARE